MKSVHGVRWVHLIQRKKTLGPNTQVKESTPGCLVHQDVGSGLTRGTAPSPIGNPRHLLLDPGIVQVRIPELSEEQVLDALLHGMGVVKLHDIHGGCILDDDPHRRLDMPPPL